MNDIRYYKGIFKLERLSKGSPMKTALYRVLEFGVVGTNDLGNRIVCPGELIIAPYRICKKLRKI